MEIIQDIFSNREIAAFLWATFFLIWANWKSNISQSVKNLLKLLFGWKILLAILLMSLYSFIEIWLLKQGGIWDIGFLKDTIFWFFGSGCVLLFAMTDVKSESQFFDKTVRNIFKFIVIYEFIVSFYSFSFITEMILLPIVTLLVMSNELAKRKEEPDYQKLHNLLNWILAILGLMFLYHSISSIKSDADNFFNWNTLQTFILPIIMTFLYIPCLYFFTLLMRYEEIFGRLNFFLEGQKRRRLAKWRVLRLCSFSLSRLDKVSKKVGRLYRTCSPDYIREIISRD